MQSIGHLELELTDFPDPEAGVCRRIVAWFPVLTPTRPPHPSPTCEAVIAEVSFQDQIGTGILG